MNRFRFRLARVLRARHVAEEVQRAQLASAERSARELEGLAEQRGEASRAACEHVRAEQSAEALEAHRVLLSQAALERTRTAESEARAQARTGRAQAEVQRTLWQGLRSDVRGLERLKERAWESFRERLEAQEELSIEQFTAHRIGAGRQSGGST